MDRRKHERVALRVPLYVVIGGEIFQKMVEFETANVSEGGLAFETHRQIPLEAESLVMVSRLGDLPPSAQIHGRVAYCSHDADRGVYVVGITFTTFQGVTPSELQERIAAWKQEKGKPPAGP
ncbi:MAG TPA: PilZ domain-containing protein [Vicinamibacteria bacterium]|nr:PilZ domain-containing protein [Vicinamibacteria bacterium]